VYNLLIVEDVKPIRDKMVSNVDWLANDYQVYQAANGKDSISVLKYK
jgi:two-component system response regulator YesN